MGQFKPFVDLEEQRRRRLYQEFVIAHKDTLNEYSRLLLDFRIEFIPEQDSFDIVMVESPQSMGN